MTTRNSQLATRNSQLATRNSATLQLCNSATLQLCNSATKKGSTLVELSIVLAIIGLLVGGILIGQSLIESAKINRLVSDLRQYEIATVQFYKKFKKYPGDSTYFIPPGNGDDLFGGGGFCLAAPNAAYTDYEYTDVWGHLSQAKMLSKTYVSFSPGASGGGLNCGGVHNSNLNAASIAGVVHPYTEITELAATLVDGNTKYPITATKGTSSANFSFVIFLKPLDTGAIENKLGTQNYSGNDQEVGLANTAGVGMCMDIGATPIACNNANAAYGYLYYYIAPQ